MGRLTGRRDGRAYIVGCPDFALPKIAGLIIQQTVDRLASIEDILGDEYDLERLRELAQADREGLVHIIQGPDPGAAVCGNCGNFIRNPGKRTGVCTEQSFYRDHHKKEEPWRGAFSPSQSRKACRKFVRRGKDKP